MPAKQTPIYPAQTFAANQVPPQQQWYDTANAAVLIGKSKKWLEALREGRKGIEGPKFIKTGPSKTSGILYNAAELLNWMNSFERYTNIHQIPQSPYADIASFMTTAAPTDLWLFAVPESGSPIEFFAAARAGMFGIPAPDAPKKKFKLCWLERQEIQSVPQSD